MDSTYLTTDQVTALAEIQNVLIGPKGAIPLAGNPMVILTIKGVVLNILDTTDKVILAMLGTSVSELTGAWAYVPGGGAAPTQVLGAAAYDSDRIHGIRYPSSKNMPGGGTCLAVFPDRLDPMRECLEVLDSSGHLCDRLP